MTRLKAKDSPNFKILLMTIYVNVHFHVSLQTETLKILPRDEAEIQEEPKMSVEAKL